MTVSSKSTQPPPNYQEMKDLISLFSIDTVMLMYIYLLMYGKTTPTKLREDLGISKATQFRNLREMERLGILKKVEDTEVKDKRYSTKYAIDSFFGEATSFDNFGSCTDYAEEYDPELAIEWKLLKKQYASRVAQYSQEIFERLFPEEETEHQPQPDDGKGKIRKLRQKRKRRHLTVILSKDTEAELIEQVDKLLDIIIDAANNSDVDYEDIENGVFQPFMISISISDFTKELEELASSN